MMADFCKVFGENGDEDKYIPKEILEELNRELPANLMYMRDDEGKYLVIPRPDRGKESIKITTQFAFDSNEDAVLIERLKQVPREEWPEYLYRIQRSISVKNIRVGDDQKLIPLEQTVGNPLSDKNTRITHGRLYPEKFSQPFPMYFENEKGDKETILFQQQIYDSLSEIKYCNINFPALKVELYIYYPLTTNCDREAKTNKDNRMSVVYSVRPKEAATVSEALKALYIFKGLFAGTTKVNGYVMTSKKAQVEFDSQKIEDALLFWNNALKLEEKLGVQFIPKAEFPMEDVRLFGELNACLNENKAIVWKHPFGSFHLNEYSVENENMKVDDLIGKDGLCFRFIEGPIAATLLGTEFEIYSNTEMTDFVITNIRWDDDTKQNGEAYITDAPGKIWMLKRRYMMKEEYKRLKEKMDNEKSKITASDAI